MKRTIFLAVALAVVAVIAFPKHAHAVKVIIYHSGEDVFETGPLPEPFDKEPKLSGAKAGYMCKIFGLFWAYFHIWNCRPVAFIGNTVYTDQVLTAAVAAKYPQSTMKVGLWTKHGRWVFIGVILVIILGVLFGGKKDKEAEEKPETED